jgi:hypothetical protein
MDAVLNGEDTMDSVLVVALQLLNCMVKTKCFID